MLRIRLTKIGKKKEPAYRVIVSPRGTPPRGGKSIEILGHYNPRLKTLSLEKERILYWLSQGAQASTTVHNLLVKENIIDGPKKKIKMPRPVVKTEENKPSDSEGKAEAMIIKPEKEVEKAT